MTQTQIVARPPGPPADWQPSEMSRPLGQALYYAERGDALPAPAPPPLIAEARAAGREYAVACRAADRGQIIEWLGRLNLAVSRPLGEADFAIRAAELVEHLADLPAAVFTRETRAEVARANRFFPGAADLTAVLGPRAAALARTLRGLRRIVGAKAPPPPARPPSVAERDRIVAAFRPAFAAAVAPARAAEAQDEDRRHAAARRAAPVSRAVLIAGYQRTADDPRAAPALRSLARTRLAALLGDGDPAPAAPPSQASQDVSASRVGARDAR